MGQDSKKCKQPSHQLLKVKAKNRVEDLELMLNEVQLARKDSRAGDVAVLEEQVSQILREWKAELDEPTPASSLREDSLGSFSAELNRLLCQYEEEDDATSPLLEPPAMRHGNVSHAFDVSGSAGEKEVNPLNHTPQQHEFQGFENHMPQQCEFQGFENHVPQQHEFQGFEHCNGIAPSLQISSNFDASGLQNSVTNKLETTTQLDDLHQYVHHDFENEIFIPGDIEQWKADDTSDISSFLSNVSPSPSAFLGPKCALWDCARPAQLSECCKNYCSSFHAELAVKECIPGTCPVLRPGGIRLKDGPLFAALVAKIEGKDVGIPECEGAATAKSPWKAPDVFDISILESEGEKVREWLFFDKPRNAFESGNRKQRSLPDYDGRGWHESRKVRMNEFGGQRRSYYADPQPQENFEWHLFEYEIDNYKTCALYRLELKVAMEKKMSPKTKSANDPLVDLQTRMGKLTAEVVSENTSSGKGRAKGARKSTC